MLAAVVVLAGGGVYLSRLYTDLSALIERRQAALSSSIYSAPHAIEAGQDLEGSRLLDRLASLHYSLVEGQPAPGQYSREGANLVVHLRGYSHGPMRHPAALLRVKVEKGRIAAVTDGAGNPARQATLEPQAIGRLASGAPAERIEARLSDQQPYLVGGLLATEDQFFYWHPGFNPVRIVAAAIADVRAGRLAQGASTLTQQLARTFLERRERSFSRKLLELATAIVLEVRLTKDEILERYINDVSLGAHAGAPIHGMPQAARYFYDRDLSQVTPAQAATLIGMVQAPTMYDPRRHPEASRKRRDAVLGIMRREGVIDEATYAAAVASPIEVRTPPALRRAPYFTDYVTAELARLPGIGTDLAGLKVFTTLDAAVQDTAAEAVRANIERLEKSYRGLRGSGTKSQKLQSAAVVLDARTGAIRALIGGRSYAESQFNRAAFALRQPGSAFKPIVYLAAMDPERSPIDPPLTLASLLPDEPMSFGGWSPENHEHQFRLRATAATALAESLNVPAAYLGSRVGPERIVRTARELGIPQDLQPLLPISIGAEETTVLDLTAAYQVIANGGTRSPVYAVESVVAADGTEIYRHAERRDPVVDADVAYLVTAGLKMAMRSGTGASAAGLGLKVPAAGKTGTTQDYRDAWFVGYTPDVVCGVWVGFDTPKSTGLTGAQAALPAWVKIVQRSAVRSEDFAVPDGIVTATIDPESGGLGTPSCPRRVTLPFLDGTDPTAPCELHGTYDVAAAPEGWGGWQLSEREPAREEPPREQRPNVFKKVGKFFGSLFRR